VDGQRGKVLVALTFRSAPADPSLWSGQALKVGATLERGQDRQTPVFARKIQVQLVGPQGPKPCPVGWLDSFFMRSFTGRAAFDETLPVADGVVEAGFGVDLEALQADLEDWLTRKFGEGKQVKVSLTEIGG